jgi:hypothetical protein
MSQTSRLAFAGALKGAIEDAGIPDPVVLKIRASIAAAFNNNPIDSPPLIVTKTGQSLVGANTLPANIAYAASTFYVHGAVVSNAGNLYIQYAFPSGTSGAASAPTATTAGLFTDGTCSWFYYGSAKATADSPLAPVVTYAPEGSLTKIYDFTTNANNFFTTGGTRVGIDKFLYSVRMDTTPAVNFTSCSFMTDAPRVCLDGNIAFFNDQSVDVVIDGRKLMESTLGVATLINPAGVFLDFSASGGRKERRITYSKRSNRSFARVAVDPLSSVWQPTNPNRFRLAFYGDSLAQGAASFPIKKNEDVATQLAMLLGTDDVYNLGLGGTGFTNATAPNYLARISDATRLNPDVLVLAGNRNDSPSTAEVAAVLLWLQTFRNACPNTIIFVAGCWAGANGAPDVNTLALEANMLTAFTQFNDSRSFFIPISTDPNGAWVFGTGDVGTPNASGNSDVYIGSGQNPHPTQSGINYLARRYFTAIKNALS